MRPLPSDGLKVGHEGEDVAEDGVEPSLLEECAVARLIGASGALSTAATPAAAAVAKRRQSMPVAGRPPRRTRWRRRMSVLRQRPLQGGACCGGRRGARTNPEPFPNLRFYIDAHLLNWNPRHAAVRASRPEKLAGRKGVGGV